MVLGQETSNQGCCLSAVRFSATELCLPSCCWRRGRRPVLSPSELWDLAPVLATDRVRERPRAARRRGALGRLCPVATSSPTLEGRRRVD